MSVKIAGIGAGSEIFGPGFVRDVLASAPLCEQGIELRLMDIDGARLEKVAAYARHVAEKMKRKATVESTTDLEKALAGAEYVISSIEVARYMHWAEDFLVPRLYGSGQIYGENGGVGGIFHALRNMGPVVNIARTMERVCPDAWLFNYSNPEQKLCEAVTRLTSIKNAGICHGVSMGKHQLSDILGVAFADLDVKACGMNHFLWFQRIRHKKTGEDLYPKLCEMDRKGDWFARWHEAAMARILFRRFGLWPAPGTNHFGEYIRWAQEFMCNELQFFYDPTEGAPWETKKEPPFMYMADMLDSRTRPWIRPPRKEEPLENKPLPTEPSREWAVNIVESMACGIDREIQQINVPNKGKIPGLPDDMVVELPADAGKNKLVPQAMQPFPEGILAMIRVQGSINKLLVESFAKRSKDILLQAVLLEPTVDSYRKAVHMVDEMCRIQKDLLPDFGEYRHCYAVR
jgi:alpha-galactosidase